MMLLKTRALRWFLLVMVVFGVVLQAKAKDVQKQPHTVITTAELKAMIDSKTEQFLIIDARNPEEFQDVHIPGAINIPAKKFNDYVKLLPRDKAAKLVFYCNGVKCGKSKRAAQKAFAMGYRKLYVYAEGMPVWEERGLPIITGPDYEAKIETTKISPQKLKTLIELQENNFTIVDVRDAAEYAEGHIPGAVNIPLASFAMRSGELDKNMIIIVYCNAGNRSYKAYRKLMKLAYKKYYQALFADWKGSGFEVK
ncbi:MAG: rhodanese-like domain-containing protein [Desulfobacteraceae bacterium]|nr:rhodanese-like domain-containing protein [Desulfobacteraceae bacterium]